MKRIILSIFLAGSVLPMGGFAQTAEALKLKRLSSFEEQKVTRNPFTPIGWEKQAPVPVAPDGTPRPVATAVSTAFFKPERFSVTSISVGALPLAMINGKAYGEGDLISVPEAEGSIQVYSVKDGKVVLKYRELTIVCPLREVGGKGGAGTQGGR